MTETVEITVIMIVDGTVTRTTEDIMITTKDINVMTNRDTIMFVTLKMIVRPETRKHLLETIKGMLEPIRVERGCLSYCLYESVENRNTFILMEQWKTQNDLENHLRSDNQRRILALMDLLSEKPEFQFDTVSHTAGMEFIENVLNADVQNDRAISIKGGG